MKIEIRRGKRGESHKFMSKIGGRMAYGANTLDLLFHHLRCEAKVLDEFQEPEKLQRGKRKVAH